MIGITCTAVRFLSIHSHGYQLYRRNRMYIKEIDVAEPAAERCTWVYRILLQKLQGVLNDSVPCSQAAGLV